MEARGAPGGMSAEPVGAEERSSLSESSVSSSSAAAAELAADESASRGTLIKDGLMTKLGRKHKTWKRRFFELRGPTLTYYTKKGGDKRGDMDLTAGSVVPKTKSYAKKELAFEISTPSRNMLLHCDSRDDLHSWCRAIQAAWSASLHLTNPGTNAMAPVGTNAACLVASIQMKA